MSAALDLAAEKALPLLVARHAAPPAPLAPGRKRLLCGADGVYVEAATSSLALCARVSRFPTPYGSVASYVRAAAGAIPRGLIAQFVGMARSEWRVEIAAVIERNGASHALRVLDGISSSAAHISYADRDIDDDTLVIDMHSHGSGRAFFSSQDDESDLSRQGPYIAMVVGRVGPDQQAEIAVRLVQPPYLIPLNFDDLLKLEVIK